MKWVVLLTLFLSSLAAAEPRFHLFLPTDRLNPAQGRYDALRLEFSDVEIGEMGRILGQSKPVLPQFPDGKPPTIPIYLSRERTEADKVAIAEEAKRQFQQAYPGVEPKLEIHYLEKEEIDVEALSKRLDTHLETIAQQLPQDDDTKKLMELLKEANQKALKDTLAQMEVKPSFFERPSVVKRIVQGIAGVRALFTFGTRAEMALAAGNQGTVPVLAGLAMVAGGPANDYFTVRFEREVDYVLNNHPLLPEKLRKGFLKNVNDFYQHNESAKLVKGSIGAALIWGMADPAIMQTLGHVNNPAVVPMVGGADLALFAETAIPGAFFANAGFIGMEKLRQQVRLSEANMDLALRGVGMLWQVAEVLLATGRPEYRSMVPLVMAPIYLGMGAAVVAPWLLPARNDRFVVVDSALLNRDGVSRREILDSTEKVEPHNEAISAKVGEVEKLKKVEVPRLGRAVAAFARGCRSVLSMVPPFEGDARWFGY